MGSELVIRPGFVLRMRWVIYLIIPCFYMLNRVMGERDLGWTSPTTRQSLQLFSAVRAPQMAPGCAWGVAIEETMGVLKMISAA